jgi:flavodoxin
MKALVVYDSVHGNTEKIARAVGEALAPLGHVTVLRVGEANPADLPPVDLLIVGSPTHGGRPTPAVQEFLAKLPANAINNVSVAAFDTRMTMVIARLFGYAAGRIADSLKDKGGRLAAAPEGFVVEGREGPLQDGELQRVDGWAKRVIASTE